MEWLLILTFHLNYGIARAEPLVPQVVPGFTSEANCKTAAEKIANELIVMAGTIKQRAGLERNAKPTPAIETRCFRVVK